MVESSVCVCVCVCVCVGQSVKTGWGQEMPSNHTAPDGSFGSPQNTHIVPSCRANRNRTKASFCIFQIT